jgi:signal transduction histidine kinase
MDHKRMVGMLAAAALAVSSQAIAQAQFGTPAEAKTMLEKAVAAVKADKATALFQFTKGEGGFKDRDLYVFCADGDGRISAHGLLPDMIGKQKMADIVDKTGKKLGEEIMQKAAEETIAEVAYLWPRPGQTGEAPKVSYVTKIGDQVCGVGYYTQL